MTKSPTDDDLDAIMGGLMGYSRKPAPILPLYTAPAGFRFMDRGIGLPCILIINDSRLPQFHEWIAVNLVKFGWCLYRSASPTELSQIRGLIERTAAKLQSQRSQGVGNGTG